MVFLLQQPEQTTAEIGTEKWRFQFNKYLKMCKQLWASLRCMQKKGHCCEGNFNFNDSGEGSEHKRLVVKEACQGIPK